MKRVLFLSLLMVFGINLAAQQVEFVERAFDFNHDDAIAIVLVHYGTNVAEVRNSTINDMSRHVKENFSGCKVVELYTHPTSVTKSRNTSQTLEELYYDGMTYVIFQPTYVAYHDDMAKVMDEARSQISSFKEVRIAKPLIFDQADSKSVAEALAAEVSTESEAVIFVADSRYESLSAESISSVQSELKEGYFIVDSADNASLEQIASSGVKSATIIPFSFLSSIESEGDIVASTVQLFEQKGIAVDSSTIALGDMESIRKIYSAHTTKAMGR